MVRTKRILAGAGVLCATLLSVCSAQAAETVSITEAGFSPNKPGMPTNAFGSATIGSTTGPVPSPITHVNVYGPAGVTLDLRGTGVCTEDVLRRVGPQGCPANSRAGFGGGEGIYQLGKELVEEKYTLDFFLSDNRPGHVKLLIFLSGSTPVLVEVIFAGTVIQGPKPYGLGFSVNVPLIKVLPEASYASAKSAFLTLGAHNVAYYARVHGKRTLLHVKGIVLPQRCPRTGWPVASQFTFEDGSTVMAKRTIPCARK
ncbi:MAG TPA: hypothetical protein VNZ01_13710 [Solirubrobacteraceae bacterium]|jgi:hypothetical protein|nr:hypothetical protein [Solirubrobacteraceae bacterium]